MEAGNKSRMLAVQGAAERGVEAGKEKVERNHTDSKLAENLAKAFAAELGDDEEEEEQKAPVESADANGIDEVMGLKNDTEQESQSDERGPPSATIRHEGRAR